MNLYQASSQWMNRPEDQRFASLPELLEAVTAFRNAAQDKAIPWKQLSVRVNEDNTAIQLVGPSGRGAELTHWAFGQLAQRAGAPASYLRELPPRVVVDALTATMPKTNEPANLLLTQNGGICCHALLTDHYKRIWNIDVVSRLVGVTELGWQVPPARPALPNQKGTRIATEADCLANSQHSGSGLVIRPGDVIAPAGLYASDHDMFVFLVNEQRAIDSGLNRPLNQGVFLWNSETGSQSFGICSFWYDFICGNHIIWSARNVKKVRIRHVGDALHRAGGEFRATLQEYGQNTIDSMMDAERTMKKARTYSLGKDKDAVLDAILGKRIPGLTRGNLLAGYAMAERHCPDEGEPNTVLGMVNGLTRVSQQSSYTDDRTNLDRAAGKLLEIVF